MKYILLLLLIGLAMSARAQVLVHTYVDPCSGKVLTVTVPLANGTTTVVYRGMSKIVTANDITSGALNVWLNMLSIAYPCPEAKAVIAQVVNQAVTQAATAATTAATSAAVSSAATSAASSASSSAASTAASTAASSSVATPTPTPAATSNTTSSGGNTENSSSSNSSSSSSESGSSSSSKESSGESKESSGESKSESKSEEKKESKSESKKESKKESKAAVKVNPMVFSSDLSIVEMPNFNVGAIISTGISKSSLMGNKSWGATSMIWSNLQQFALSVRQTNMSFDKGKLSMIQNYSFTTVYAMGNVFGLAGYTHIIPTPTGIAGANFAVSFMKVAQMNADLSQLGLGSSIALFYMRPIKVTKRTTLTPDVFLMASPVSYTSKEGQFTTSPLMIILTGVSGDLSITKRFKINWSYKINYNPDEQTAMSMLNIGTRMNL